jgi:hypothetical protein
VAEVKEVGLPPGSDDSPRSSVRRPLEFGGCGRQLLNSRRGRVVPTIGRWPKVQLEESARRVRNEEQVGLLFDSNLARYGVNRCGPFSLNVLVLFLWVHHEECSNRYGDDCKSEYD